MLRDRSWLQCIRCEKRVPLYGTTRFVCECGGLYDVQHDFSHIKGKEITYLKKLFHSRRIPELVPTTRNPFPTVSHSGVWRFHELIMPSLSSDEIVSLGEGIMPFWRAGKNLSEWIGKDIYLWIMPEGQTPTGSFKDFGMTAMVSTANASGVKAIVCASTGDTSASVAAYAAAAGMTCAVVLPRGKVTSVQLAQPLAHGAKVVTIPGSFDECMRVVRELVAAGRVFPANSINPTRIEGHQATVFLTAQFFDWHLPSWFVVPLGNGSNTSSVGKGIRTLETLNLVEAGSRILAVQSEAANPLARSWEAVASPGGYVELAAWQKAYRPLEEKELGGTAATAALIGNPVSYEKVMREITLSDGAVLTASEGELNKAVMVAGLDGFFVCPQTGMALAGLRRAIQMGLVQRDDWVVVVSTATGLKFPDVPAQMGKWNIVDLPGTETERVAEAIGV